MKIYTKTGDEGTTGTLDNKRISKNHPCIHLIGTTDEFTSALGLAKTLINDEMLLEDVVYVQQDIIAYNAQIIGGNHYTTHQNIHRLEQLIDKYQKVVGGFQGFILPGGSQASASLDLARTIARRAERIATELKEKRQINDFALVYLNRLSDLTYVMARYLDVKDKVREIVIRAAADTNVGNKADDSMTVQNNGKLSLSAAKQLADQIEKKAAEKGLNVVIAMVDEGANLVLVHSMDDAFIVSTEIAINKAYTSVALKMPTEKVLELSQPGNALYGLQYSNTQRIVVLGGGIPLVREQKIIGGLGVSGGTAEQDIELAAYGAQILKDKF